MKRCRMPIFVMLLVFGFFQGTALGADEASCSVKYLSAEHVYLDAGTAAGLSSGMQARVVRDGTEIAILEIVFTARFSASCKVISSTGEVQPGDTVVFEKTDQPEAPETVAPDQTNSSRVREFSGNRSRRVVAGGSKVKGYVGLQWDHSSEGSGGDISNDLFSLPFRVKVEQLGRGFDFRARGSFRKLQRSGYKTSITTSEWRNRIQEVSLIRNDRRQDLHLAVGRVATVFTSSAGPMDGLAVNYRMAPGVRLGIFGGNSPEWGTLGFGNGQRLYGAGLNYNRRSDQGAYLDILLSGVGRYTVGSISREYFTLVTSWRDGKKLSLMQSAQVDLNRNWRKDDDHGSLELTSLALSGRYRVDRKLALNLGYDNREPVRTWESRALPDSLFVDAGRKGLRGGMTWRPGGGRSLSLWGSVRDHKGGGETSNSWSGRVYLPRLTPARIDVRLGVRGFSGTYLSGISPTLSLNHETTGGLDLGADLGYYKYKDIGGLPDRNNSWVTLSAGKDLARRLSMFVEYRRDFGEDLAGNRLLVELRRRF